MTPEETEAIDLFVRIVTELGLAQETLDREAEFGGEKRKKIANQLNVWANSLRSGVTQEYLNSLASKCIRIREDR